MMITLQCYEPSFGEISASPFSAKSIYMMTYSKMEWVRENLTDPRAAPLGKLPVAHYKGRVIHDSENIRALIEEFGIDFDGGLSDAERGCGQAFVRLAEENLYFHQVHDRWINDDIWPIVKQEYFGFLPPVVRSLVPNALRKNLRRGLMAQGIARFSENERIDRAKRDFVAIEQQLGTKPFLFGDKPTAADFSVVPVLRGIRAAPKPTALSRSLDGFHVLVDYLARADRAMLNP